MAGISLSGLASGLDWQTLVSNLMTAERTPETAWKAQQSANTTKITSLNQIKTDLTALQTAAQALNDDSVFGARSATLANTGSGWIASAAANTVAGQYTFQVQHVATQAQRVGSADVGAPISTSSIVSAVTVPMMNLTIPPTPGIFTVNGVQIVVNSTDSLQDIFTKIANATQQAVTASYDSGTDTVSLKSSGEIVLGSSADTSNLLTALKLYSNGGNTVTSTSSLGVVNTGAAIANANLKGAITDVDSSGNGSFSINGVSINFNVNNDSLQAVMDRINNSAAGVTINYDKISDQFSLTSKTTGDVNLSVSEASGGLLEALGLNSTSSLVRGTNAQVQVNNGPLITSTSNTFDQSVTGINGLSVTAASTGTQTVTVGNDTSNATSKINDFITAYNALQSFIDSQAASSTDSTGKVSKGDLAGDRDITDFSSSLRQMMFNAIPGLSGTIQRLDSIGIGFTGTSSVLSVNDSSKLDTALRNNPADVANLFNSQPNGLVAQINAFVARTTSSTGLIATETNNLTDANKSLTDQINSLEKQVTNDQTRLTSEFTAMEAALSRMQTETQTLNAYFGTNSGSSSSGSSSKSSG